MIATLPMYERPRNRAAHDRFWRAVRRNLGTGPEELNREIDLWDGWNAPELLFSQTCGMPYRNDLHGRVQIICTPDYGLSDKPGYYHSVYVTRAGDCKEVESYADRRLAFNQVFSQSGYAAPLNDAQDRGFAFTDTLQTGAHVHSAAAVVEDRADIAAIDVVTWSLIRDEFDLSGLQVIGETGSTPGLPFITGMTQSAGALYSAVTQALDSLQPEDKSTLRIKDLVQILPEAYLAVPNPTIG